MHRLTVAETNFRLGRVDVHINPFRWNVQKQHKRWRNLIMQHIAIRLLDRVQHHFIAHKTIVYKAKLQIRFAFRKSWLGNKTAQTQGIFAAIHRQTGCLKIRTHNFRHALFRRLCWIMKHVFAIVFQRKLNLRIRQRQTLQHRGAMRVFRVF
nr:hypothetical protein [Kingella negevensis]